MRPALTLRAPGAPAWVAPVAFALGCVALAARPVAWRASLTTAVILAIGVLGAVPPSVRAPRARVVAATLVGIAAFAGVRLIDAPVGMPFTLAGAAAVTLAAVAEEAFFRRYAYAWLARWGAAVAVVVTAVAFALVHLPTYGPGVLGIDLFAGLLLGWQRWTTGGWAAPAVTHVAANLLMMG